MLLKALAEASYTIRSFVDSAVALMTGLCGMYNSQASCLDLQVFVDFRPYCLVAQDDFLAKANQSCTSPPRVAQAAL